MITGGTAIAVGEHAVYGIDLATGRQVWQLIRNGGPLSMPAIGMVARDEVLVFLDESSVGPSIVGVDLSTLRERWRVPLDATARSGVTVDDATAYAADEKGTVYAVSLATGALLWTANTIGRVEGPLAVADATVYAVARDPDQQLVQLVALDPQTGDERWSFSPRVGVATASVPAAGDGQVVVGSADRLIRGLASSDGVERWEALSLSLFSPVSAPSDASGHILIADASGGMYRVDATDGSRVWDYQLNELIVRSSPVLAGSTALLGLNDGRLVAIDVGAGTLVWESAAEPGLIGTIALSPRAVVAVKGGRAPGLVAFAHDPDGALVDVPSPTKVDPGQLFGNFAIAFVACVVVIYLPFRTLRSRRGSPIDAAEGDPSGDRPEDGAEQDDG